MPILDVGRSHGLMSPLTFKTPFERFRFTGVQFGITPASEHFQWHMSTLLSGLKGVSNYIDVILVYGKTIEEPNKKLRLSLAKISEANMMLNMEKCKFLTKCMNFFRHTIDASGIQPNQDKVKALQKMPSPSNTTEFC